MFNAPRPAQRYVGSSSNGFGSFVDENPLSASGYDGLDPWSNQPSPSSTPAPQSSSVFAAVIADADVPSVYNQALAAVDPDNTGETSVNSLSRVLATSSLPAATIDRVRVFPVIIALVKWPLDRESGQLSLPRIQARVFRGLGFGCIGPVRQR